MIEDTKFFVESMLIPYSYRTIFKKINSEMNTSEHTILCSKYREKLENSFRNDVPKIEKFSNYTHDDFLRNVIFLKQAQNFRKFAKDAITEVKPLLLYYAESQFFAFFIYSIFHFDGPAKGHGLSMTGNSLKNIGIKFQESGFFQRIVNTYSLLDASWIFSPLEIKDKNEIKKCENLYQITKKPTITLDKLIELKDQCRPNYYGHDFDQLDFLFIFLASSLARYKPDLWHTIVNGDKGNQIAYFKQSFSRFEKLWDRLFDVLYSLYRGRNYIPTFYTMDEERIESQYEID